MGPLKLPRSDRPHQSSSDMPQTFRDLIAVNKRNSVLLVAAFCLFVATVAMILGLAVMAFVDPDRLANLDWTEGLTVGSLAGVIALVICLFAYYGGSNFVLAVSGAQPISPQDDPELFNVVEEMAIAAGVPMPHLPHPGQCPQRLRHRPRSATRCRRHYFGSAKPVVS